MTKINDIKYIWNLLCSTESHIMQRFHDSLQLSEDLAEVEESSLYKPPFSINYLEYYDSKEPYTSLIIRHIFAYSHNGHHPYWESFAEHFLQEKGFKTEWIEKPIIDKDHEYRNIDILIRENGKYAVIIENKLKGAYFQLNQLARYIATMRQEGFSDNQIFVVVLPKRLNGNDLHDSVWKLPKDWQYKKDNLECKINAETCECDYVNYKPKDHCKKCESLKVHFKERTLFIHNELSNWLYDCVTNNTMGIPEYEYNKQYVLKSAILQFVDYLNYLYETRENDKYKMEIKDFLSKELKLDELSPIEQLSLINKKKQDVEELSTRLGDLYDDITKEFITEIETTYGINIKLCDSDHIEWSFDFNGTNLKVSTKSEGKKYYCQIETDSNIMIPKSIMDALSTELTEKEEGKNYKIWKYDTFKESLSRFKRVVEICNKQKKAEQK